MRSLWSRIHGAVTMATKLGKAGDLIGISEALWNGDPE